MLVVSLSIGIDFQHRVYIHCARLMVITNFNLKVSQVESFHKVTIRSFRVRAIQTFPSQ